MGDTGFPRRWIRRLDDPKFPMLTLRTIREARAYLNDLEGRTLAAAREAGASIPDIADSLGISRQAVYSKLQRLEQSDQIKEGSRDES